MPNYFDQFDNEPTDVSAPLPRAVPRIPGNIDLNKRPVVKNADGTVSTVRSISANFDGSEYLIPTVSDDGRILDDDAAVDLFRRSGKHLGAFSTPQEATAFAESLHTQQERQYAPRPEGNFFDQFDEEEQAPAPAIGLRRPDGALTELGWEAERTALGEARQKEVGDESFFSNLVAGFGRAGPTLAHGVKQLGVDALGHLGDNPTGTADNALTRWADTTGGRLREETASERVASADLLGTGGGMLGNVLGDIAVSLPLGGVGLAPKGASLARGITQAAATGGAWGSSQAVAKEGEREQNVALGTGLGGGLSALGRGALALGENVLPSNVTARALNWFGDRANQQPFAAEGEALAQRTGIDLTPGMISGSRAQTGAENMARQSLFSADTAFKADEKVANQAIDHVNRIMGKISPDSVSAETVGERIQGTVRKTVEDIVQNRETTASRQYAAIRNVVGDTPVVTYDSTKNTLREILAEYDDVVGADAKRIRHQTQRLLDEMGAKDAFTLDAARRSRGFYGRAAARSANVFTNISPDLNAKIAKRLYGAMSRDLDAAAERVDEAAGFGKNMPVPDGVIAQRPSEMLRKANDDYRRHSQLLEAVETSPLKRLLGDQVNVEDFMTVNALAPETVVARVAAMKPTEVGMLRDLMTRQAPDAWQQYKRLIVEDAMSIAQTAPASAGAKTLPFNAGGFVRALGGDKPDKIERLRVIMDPGEMEEINDALQAARRMGDKFGANFSGTGPYNEMMQAVQNFTVRGLTTTASTATGFNRIAKLMLNSDGRRALIELARLPPGSRKATDVAAYLGSIATVDSVNDKPLELDIVGGTPISQEEAGRQFGAP